MSCTSNSNALGLRGNLRLFQGKYFQNKVDARIQELLWLWGGGGGGIRGLGFRGLGVRGLGFI